jgi:hypothetical protein
VPISNDDPWLRRPAPANVATPALPKISRAFGTAD